MSRPLPPTVPQRRGVFTTEEALRAGWTESALAHAVRRGRLVRVASGCYVDATAWIADGPDAARHRLLLRTIAALATVNTSAASHSSAALLADLPLWTPPARPCLTVAPRYTGDARAAHLHRATLTETDLVRGASGIRTSTARTILDIARERGVDEAVVVGDAALARQLTDAQRLVTGLQRCAGWPGVRRARHAVEALDPRSESPLESISRVRLHRTSLPRPELQTDILTRSGMLLGRLDFYWDEFGIAGEVDGLVKYRDDPFTAMMQERRRQGRMEELGLIFVRWGRADLGDMRALAGRLEHAFARGQQRPRTQRGWLARFAPQTYALAG